MYCRKHLQKRIAKRVDQPPVGICAPHIDGDDAINVKPFTYFCKKLHGRKMPGDIGWAISVNADHAELTIPSD